MALSGLEIYKQLPKTNCKDCGFPTCLAFAMKLATKGIELSACPHVSEQAKAALEAASAPPIRLITVGAGDRKIEVGNEVVMFRHEKTYYHPCGVVVKVKDTSSKEEIAKAAADVANFTVERVGLQLRLDGLVVENASGDKGKFVEAVDTAAKAGLPLILMASDPAVMAAALTGAAANKPLIYAATADNWKEMAELAKKHSCPIVVKEGAGLNELAALVKNVVDAGVVDVVLDPGACGPGESLQALTQIRRLALKKNFRGLGYPIITFPCDGAETKERQTALAAQQIYKYAGIVVLDSFDPTEVYPLLTLRLNVYTDPQKPIQVEPKLYAVGAAGAESPLLVTTNFSLTYFTVMGEIEGSGIPSWLLVADAEGMSVLTAWAAGKFDAERIAKAAKTAGVDDIVSHKKIVLPGYVAVLSGELEEELPGWHILVGPREAVDISGYLKKVWTPN